MRLLTDVASTSFVVAYHACTVYEIRSQALGATWVVVVDDSGRAIALTRGEQLHDSDGSLLVWTLVDDPIAILPADLPASHALQSWPVLEQVNRDGMRLAGIVAERDDRPVAVLAGVDLSQRLLDAADPTRNANDGQLPGRVVAIPRLSCRCRYVDQDVRCNAVRVFVERPDQMPECDNPARLTTHRFVR